MDRTLVVGGGIVMLSLTREETPRGLPIGSERKGADRYRGHGRRPVALVLAYRPEIHSRTISITTRGRSRVRRELRIL